MQLDTIIEGCIKKDRQAQSALYRRYAPLLMRVCRRYTYSDFEADDVFQEAFVRIFTHIHKYNPQEGKIEGWLYRVTVNVAIRQLNQQKKHRHEDIDTPSHTTTVELSDSLTLEELHGLIDQLPPGQKAVFNLYAIDGYSHKEIADLLGMQESASRSQLVRAREALKKMHAMYNREKSKQESR